MKYSKVQNSFIDQTEKKPQARLGGLTNNNERNWSWSSENCEKTSKGWQLIRRVQKTILREVGKSLRTQVAEQKARFL